MDSPDGVRDIGALVFMGEGIGSSRRNKFDVNATTVGLSMPVLQLTVADEHWLMVVARRLARTQLERWILHREANVLLAQRSMLTPRCRGQLWLGFLRSLNV